MSKNWCCWFLNIASVEGHKRWNAAMTEKEKRTCSLFGTLWTCPLHKELHGSKHNLCLSENRLKDIQQDSNLVLFKYYSSQYWPNFVFPLNNSFIVLHTQALCACFVYCHTFVVTVFLMFTGNNFSLYCWERFLHISVAFPSSVFNSNYNCIMSM